jgi:hypothetical protein
MPELMTISELARAEGVDKALMSRRIKALKLETTPGPRGAKFVDLARYKEATGRPVAEAPKNVIEYMARRGKFGSGEQLFNRLEAAKLLRARYVKACAGDEKADGAIDEIEKMLGDFGTELVYHVVLGDQPLERFRNGDVGHLQMVLKAHLDSIAEKFQLRARGGAEWNRLRIEKSNNRLARRRRRCSLPEISALIDR